MADGHCPSVGAGPLESRANPLKPLAWQVRSCSTLPWLKHFDAVRRVFPAVHLAGSCCVCVCAGQSVPQSWTQLCCARAGMCSRAVLSWQGPCSGLWGVLVGHTGGSAPVRGRRDSREGSLWVGGCWSPCQPRGRFNAAPEEQMSTGQLRLHNLFWV